MPDAISVTRLVRRMRNLLEIELGEVWVEGEISNLRKQASGHQYFTLKDEGGQIPCVLFRGNARHAKCDLKDGLKVVVFAEASLYEARGQVQLIIRKVEQQGQGDLQQKFEQLKAKLQQEGLFDQESKKTLPSHPTSIGLITSESGAALQDMLNVLSRRAPWVQPILYPVQVQGQGAEEGIANAINDWSHNPKLPQVDLIIVGRGGGSLEDLWNFNEEVVARAIADCCIPIISAVGHETDFTIADFVADHRAPTPSAAAEIAVPDKETIQHQLATYASVADRTVSRRLEYASLLLEKYKQTLLVNSPENLIRENLLRLDQLSHELDTSMENKLEQFSTQIQLLKQRLHSQRPLEQIEILSEKFQFYQEKLESTLTHRLDQKTQQLQSLCQMHRALGPETAFNRGFSITTKADGSIVKKVDDIASGEKISTRLGDGSFESTVR